VAGAVEASAEAGLSFFLRDEDFLLAAVSAVAVLGPSAAAVSDLELFFDDFFVEAVSPVALESGEAVVSFDFFEDDVFALADDSPEEAELSPDDASAFFFFFEDFDFEVSDEGVELSDEDASDFLVFFDFLPEEAED